MKLLEIPISDRRRPSVGAIRRRREIAVGKLIDNAEKVLVKLIRILLLFQINSNATNPEPMRASMMTIAVE